MNECVIVLTKLTPTGAIDKRKTIRARNQFLFVNAKTRNAENAGGCVSRRTIRARSGDVPPQGT